MPNIAIACHADAAALADLARITFAQTFTHYPPDHLQTFLSVYTPAYFSALIADPAHRIWIARDGDETVGYAHAGPCALPHTDVTPACGELKRLYVRQGAQKGGIGSALLREALGWLSAPGRTLWVGVFSENPGAQRLYERHGFQKAGEYAFVVGGTHDREYILRRG